MKNWFRQEIADGKELARLEAERKAKEEEDAWILAEEEAKRAEEERKL